MATVAMADLRRTDLRTSVLTNTYWITSAEMKPVDIEDKAAVLFSFPTAAIANSACPTFYGNSTIVIKEMVMEINTAAVGGTPALTLGRGSLALQTTIDLVTTIGSKNQFATGIAASGLTNSIGLYPLHATSAYDTARVAGQHTADYAIPAAASTVICIVAYFTDVGTFSAGSFYLHVLIDVVPVVS